MNPKWIVMAMASGCLSGQFCAAGQPELRDSVAKPEVTDEVLVRGTRLRELRAAVVAAEDRFYEQYNALNKVDDYDVECFKDVRTGTRIPQRRCFTKLQLEAMSQQGKEVLQMMQDHPKPIEGIPGQPAADQGPAGMTGAGRLPNTNPEAIWLAHYDDYRDNMLYLLKMNPGLRRLAQAGEDAKRRYDSEHKRRLKGRLILID